jgi:hypothetical protein
METPEICQPEGDHAAGESDDSCAGYNA